jgi:hypothetical protein
MAKKEDVPVSQRVVFMLYKPGFNLETRMISHWG